MLFALESELPLFREVDKTTHEQNIICRKTLSDGNAHEYTIICRQLFAGHVVDSRPMKRKNTIHRMIVLFITYQVSKFDFSVVSLAESVSRESHQIDVFTGNSSERAITCC